MFRSPATRVRTWLMWTEDVLGDEREGARDDQDRLPLHPHRRPLRWERARRPGSVAARPSYCISPLRTMPDREQLEQAAR